MAMKKDEGQKILLGIVGVDSGQLVIHDPCYERNQEGLKYDNMMEARLDTCPKGMPRSHNNAKRYTQLNYQKGHEGLGVVFNSGMGDGTYEVWGTVRNCGPWGPRVTKVEVIMVEDDAFCPKCGTYLDYDLDDESCKGFCPKCGWKK
jgi:hypothetical protein